MRIELYNQMSHNTQQLLEKSNDLLTQESLQFDKSEFLSILDSQIEESESVNQAISNIESDLISIKRNSAYLNFQGFKIEDVFYNLSLLNFVVNRLYPKISNLMTVSNQVMNINANLLLSITNFQTYAVSKKYAYSNLSLPVLVANKNNKHSKLILHSNANLLYLNENLSSCFVEVNALIKKFAPNISYIQPWTHLKFYLANNVNLQVQMSANLQEDNNLESANVDLALIFKEIYKLVENIKYYVNEIYSNLFKTLLYCRTLIDLIKTTCDNLKLEIARIELE